MNLQLVGKPLEDMLAEMYGDAYVLGQDAAAATLGAVEFDWDKWKPGYRAAAELVKPSGGLRGLLDKRGITIQGMNETTLNQLGRALAESLDEGMSVRETAKSISDTLANPERAMLIAQTETNRAMCTASVESYSEAGVEQVEWLVAEGCKDCQINANASPIPIGSVFPTGDTEPPAHPNCLCDIAPVFDVDKSLTIDKWDESDHPRDERGRFTAQSVSDETISSLTEQAGTLTDEERKAVGRYQGSGYAAVNNWLRSGHLRHGWTQEVLGGYKTQLDGAIAKSVMPEESVVFRGVDESVASQLEVGDSFFEAGFLSTTHDENTARHFGTKEDDGGVLRITVPEGTPALLAEVASGSLFGESEVLLGSGHTITITDILTIGGVKYFNAALDSPATTTKSDDWDESEHPRDDDGRFTSGDDGPSDPITATTEVVDLMSDGGAAALVRDINPDDREEAATDIGGYVMGSGQFNDTLRAIDEEARQTQIDDYWDSDRELFEGSVGNISAAIQAHTLTEPLEVYRGVDMEFTNEEGESILDPGTRFTDLGFTSTSLSRDNAIQFADGGSGGGVLLQIQLPEGTHALYVPEFLAGTEAGETAGAMSQDEQELLLDHGTTFETLGSRVEDGRTVVDMRVVPADTANKWDEADHPRDESGRFTTGAPDLVVGDDTHQLLAFAAQKLTEEQAQAVGRYQFHDGQRLNGQLRAGDDWDKTPVPQFEEFRDALSSAIDRSPLPQDITLYRGVRGDFAGELQVGDSFTERGFLSTTHDFAVARAFSGEGAIRTITEQSTVLSIHVPAGTPALLVSETANAAKSMAEGEVLLGTDHSIEITGESVRAGVRVLEAELMAVAKLLKSDWSEDDHPRDEKGRFTRQSISESVFGDLVSKGESLTTEQMVAVHRYQVGGASADVNDALRSGALRGSMTTWEHVEEFRGVLDSAIAQSPLPEDITVYRGVDSQFASMLNVGDSFMDEGFLSTSYDEQVALQFAGWLAWGDELPEEFKPDTGAVLRITASAGTPGLLVEAAGGAPMYESEILFQSGTGVTLTGRTVENGVVYFDARIEDPSVLGKMVKADWNEEDHPRDEAGRFSNGDGEKVTYKPGPKGFVKAGMIGQNVREKREALDEQGCAIQSINTSRECEQTLDQFTSVAIGEIESDDGFRLTAAAMSDGREFLIAQEEGTSSAYKLDTVQNTNGDLAGAILYHYQDSTDVFPPHVYIDYLGTTGMIDGAGSSLFGEALQFAADRGVSIELSPLDVNAMTFWMKMGFAPAATENGGIDIGRLVMHADDVRDATTMMRWEK